MPAAWRYGPAVPSGWSRHWWRYGPAQQLPLCAEPSLALVLARWLACAAPLVLAGARLTPTGAVVSPDVKGFSIWRAALRLSWAAFEYS